LDPRIWGYPGSVAMVVKEGEAKEVKEAKEAVMAARVAREGLGHPWLQPGGS